MRFDIKAITIVISTTLAACSGTPRSAAVAAAAPPHQAPMPPAAANSATAAAPAQAAQIQTEKQNVTKAKDLLNQANYSCMGTSCNN
jgi:hypothetical protein